MEAVGIAFGVDRFVMLLTGASSMNDVVPFPALERFGSQAMLGVVSKGGLRYGNVGF